VAGPACACRKGRAARREPKETDGEQARESQNAVHKLDGDEVLEEVSIERLQVPKSFGDPLALHERKGVVGESGVESGDEAARDQGREDETEDGEAITR